ncbi:MAG: DNA polymerase I [Pseudomonadota bacterium]|nr:DNA polymerase I [Pseudomonadota bacterium]MDE3038379.1 DNA polymerase I [Pseudomonadota bacterium]
MQHATSNHEQPATSNGQRKLYLIDGSGFIFRAYHALPPLTDPQGLAVGAVYGFVNMLMKLMEGPRALHANNSKGGPPLAGQADYVAVVFDVARKTFRNRIYADYKAHRPPPPDDLIPQFALVREATDALNIARVEMADYEADDIIAAYAKAAQAAGVEVTIVSSDKDLMQLIGGGVKMYDAMKQKDIGEAEVKEKFGVGPEKVLDVLALIGDASDNVPGVPGIGPKTAAELIGQFGDLETLLARANEIKQPRRRETLLQNVEQARMSKELITLKTDVPGLPPLEGLALRAPEPEKLVGFLQAHGFRRLVERLQQKGMTGDGSQASNKKEELLVTRYPTPVTHSYTIIHDEKTLAEWIANAMKKGTVAFDTETTSLNALQAELVGFSLCVEESEACYVPLGHRVAGDGSQVTEKEPNLFNLTPDTRHLSPGQIPLARALAHLKPLLEDESVLKVGHNIKYDMLVMQTHGIAISPIEDTMLLSYVLHAGAHGQGMDELAERYLPPSVPPAGGRDVRGGYKTISYDEVTGSGRNRLRFDEVEIEKAGQYAAEDADVTLRLYHYFKPQVAAEKLLALYETIERPLVSVLAEMETAGIKVDEAQLAALSRDFAARMAGYEREIHALAGQAFNIGSPKQLGEILFDRLQVGGGRKSARSGAYSTGSEILEELAGEGHAIAAKVLEWRQLSKLKSTYSDALAGQIDPNTGRVHTSFAQAIASTGRLSSSDPNLQNIPIRTEEGRKIRNAFIAEPGFKLLSADYSQIELRLLAHIADIPTLKEAFRNGDDIHAITAGQMFGVAANAVDADLRRKAKTINFGIIYGISAHGLASRLGIGRSEAGAYIEQYFKQYPGIRDYMESAKEFARAHGYVTTLFGRRCHLPGIHDKNGARRQFSERAAINAPLQGTAADIIKKAMVSLSRELRSSGTWPGRDPAQSLRDSQDVRMLLQVHDELVFEVKESAIPAARALVKKHMENVVPLSVPLTVETGVGAHWGEAH